MFKKLALVCVAATMVFGLVQGAHATLSGVGPTSPKTNFPDWYFDANGRGLQLCLDGDGVNGFCIFAPVVVGNPLSEQTGFGPEAFWTLADASLTTSAGLALLVMGLEAAYLSPTGDPLANTQISFGRIRIRIDTPAAGTYTVTHPFGTDVFPNAPAGINAINFTEDIGGGTLDFKAALNGRVGPFLRWTDPDYPVLDPATGNLYIGNPQVLHTITGSPLGAANNVFRVSAVDATGAPIDLNGAAAGTALETNLFTLCGKLFPGALAADFGAQGLWEFKNATWANLTPTAPQGIAGGPTALYGDFGAAGLYKYSAGVWTQITTSDPVKIEAVDALLYGDFGAAGLYKYDGTTWTKLSNSSPASMIASEQMLYADFGASGLYMYDGLAWTYLYPSSPVKMAASGRILYADLGAAGLYKYDGGLWTSLNGVSPEAMIVSGPYLYADFGASGLWSYNNSINTWKSLTNSNATVMAANGSLLVADFGAGAGIYRYDGTSWLQLTTSSAAKLALSGSVLYGDFGAAGVYKYDANAWTYITPATPVSMTGLSIK